MTPSWKFMGLVVTGSDSDQLLLSRAKLLSEVFDAQVSVLYASPESESLPTWFGEGMMGNFNQDILDEIQKLSKETFHKLAVLLPEVGFQTHCLKALATPLWEGLSKEVRLMDIMVFDAEAALGKGLSGEAFQQVLMEEKACVYVARHDPHPRPKICVAWDGSPSSSRAARSAIPLLKLASHVVIATAPLGDEPADPSRLKDYYQAHNIEAEICLWPLQDVRISIHQDIENQGFDLLVAGAYGHSRFHEFVFGGTTRSLLSDEKVNLFLAHYPFHATFLMF
jgi:nucleotide-binding universal stress UspA family protein